MPVTREKYVPKHRQASAPRLAAAAPGKVLRSTLLLTSVAVAATGGVVASGVAGGPATISSASHDLRRVVSEPSGGRVLAERDAPVSRSDRRDAADPAKEAALSQEDGPAVTRTESLSDEDPRSIGRALLGEFGFSSDQFDCLDSLWTKESNWTVDADNPTSSAYGIPQALPGSKMASAGADWATNPVTQIRWGLGYIRDSYGSPCSAWSHSQSVGWY